MKYNLRYTGEFKRSLKRCLKRGYDEQLLTDVLKILATECRVPDIIDQKTFDAEIRNLKKLKKAELIY